MLKRYSASITKENISTQIAFEQYDIIILRPVQLPFLKNIKSPHIKKYVANTSWVFADFILRQGINILVGIYVARYLLPEGLGKLSYATTYVQLLQPLAHIGLTAIVIRDLVKFRKDTNKILGTAFVFKLIASILSFVLIVAITVLSVQVSIESKILVIIASSSVLVSPLQVLDFYFQSEVKAKFVVYSQQIAAISASALRLIGVFASFSISWFVWMFVLEIVLTGGVLLFFYFKNNQTFKNWQYDRAIAKRFLNELGPVIFSGFFVALYMRIDQIMIYDLLNDKALGLYTAAVKLCEPFYVVATMLCSSLFPAIVNGLEISRTEYEHRLQRLFNILTWIAILTSSVIHFLAPFVISIIYGEQYVGSEKILQIYFWASILVFQGVVAGQAYVVEKLQLYGTMYTFIGAAVNIGLNFILIPKMGPNGAALATLISYTLSATLLNAVFKPTRAIFKQQILALTAIFTKPKHLISAFHARKTNT